LLLVQPTNSHLQAVSKIIVAADPKNIAGVGDLIVYVTSTDAIQAFDHDFVPVNASVVQLIDSID
ncbi:MAG: EutN/CcmL family microcompartment protein, partial [bacterium]|nr:EutN/CcmL family microcompartment protein [bacterium]